MTSDGVLSCAFTPADYQRRYVAVRALLDREHLDAFLIFGTSSECRMNQADIYWLSNSSGVRANCLFFPGRGDPVLFVHSFNHVPYAQRVSALADVRPGGGGSAAHDVGEGLAAELTLREMGAVGVVKVDALPAVRPPPGRGATGRLPGRWNLARGAA